ncbi:hypothetical protein BV898_05897 [Hypsibius exemplaris]|uniref:G-protein coupled receptors family 1 profile domain-containing protein n=1 Tax=Hypsibius exemplaris TaxID=2072580 RepID=A0A1W0WY24_HYPEX|nr:hypothetical protein BV898_05897 [Hypsibius exemplaris]
MSSSSNETLWASWPDNSSYYNVAAATEDRATDGTPDQAVIFCGFMIPFLIIGILGHVTVLLSVLYHEDLHRPLNVMIVNLSVSQFFMLTISVFGNVLVMLTNDNYTDFTMDGRDGPCFLTVFFSTSTSVFYGLIALNRLFSTVLETLYNRLAPWKMVWVLVVAGWVLSLLGSVFPFMTRDVDFFTDTFFFLGLPWFHQSVEADSSGIFWLLTWAYFIIPAVSIVSCYAAIYLYTWRSQRLSGLPVNSPRAINLRDRARVVLMLLTASAWYLVCFYTSMIYWSQGGKRSRTGRYFFLWLVFAQNALNPVIYGLITPQFRDAYLRIFSMLFRRRSCCQPYLDNSVGPGGESIGGGGNGPPSVMYSPSAKNSMIVFPPNHFNGPHDYAGSAVGQSRSQLPMSARNLELKVKDVLQARDKNGSH